MRLVLAKVYDHTGWREPLAGQRVSRWLNLDGCGLPVEIEVESIGDGREHRGSSRAVSTTLWLEIEVESIGDGRQGSSRFSPGVVYPSRLKLNRSGMAGSSRWGGEAWDPPLVEIEVESIGDGRKWCSAASWPPLTLRSLLSEKTVFAGTIQVAIQGTAARVEDVDGAVTVMAGNGYGPASSWNGGLTATMRHELVPCLQWESERAFERGIALALVGACGGRVTEVSDWQHLPPLMPTLFGGGYGRAKLLFCHPATASKLFMAAMQDPMRMWLTPASPRGSAQYCGAEVFPSAYFDENTLVFVQDGNEVGKVVHP